MKREFLLKRTLKKKKSFHLCMHPIVITSANHTVSPIEFQVLSVSDTAGSIFIIDSVPVCLLFQTGQVTILCVFFFCLVTNYVFVEKAPQAEG